MTGAPESSRNLDEVFALALEDLASGMSVDEVLARYPAHAAELRPLIETSQQFRRVEWPRMSAYGRVRGRERMHAALGAKHGGILAGLRPLLGPVAAITVLVALASGAWLARPQRHGSLATATVETTVAPEVATPTVHLTATLEPTSSSTPTSEVRELTATLSPTKSPTSTLRPTATVTASATPSPTATSTKSASATATRRPATPTLTPSPSATWTLAPSPVPAPPDTHTPAPPSPVAPSPTHTLAPSPTPDPTDHDDASPTPKPSKTPD